MARIGRKLQIKVEVSGQGWVDITHAVFSVEVDQRAGVIVPAGLAQMLQSRSH